MVPADRDCFHPTSRLADPPITARVGAWQLRVTVGDPLHLDDRRSADRSIAAPLAGGSTLVRDLVLADPGGTVEHAARAT